MGADHLYIHVPFCRLVCAYCDFVTVGGRSADIPRYVDALSAELAMRPLEGPPRTIYFGGGTPSLLPAEAIACLVQAATQPWRERPLEVTVEANPSTRETPDWAGLRAAGVNRISLGAQSLSDAQLAGLARGHTAAEVRSAYAGVRRAGFDNVSLDLIYGIPGQSLDDWRADLADAVALAPDHLSLYALQLAVEPDEWAAPPRPGALRWRRVLLAQQDDELAGAQYAAAEELLGSAGYEHYELSSWARPGRRSAHNSAYWARWRYTGIGAGAHSYDGVAIRSWNDRDLDRYLSAVEAGRLPEAGREVLDEPTRAFEAVALGLRAVDGFDRTAFAKEFGADPAVRYADGVAQMQSRGLLEVCGDVMRLTPAGRLLANEVLLAFLPQAPQAARRRTSASTPA
jgi:oxygen-independent coproporphyrinogen-3 oxidase